MISVICVTRNRREFIPRLIAQFQKQGYPSKELVIVSAGDSIDDLIPVDPRIRHFVQTEGAIGAAVNIGVQEAKGEFCVRFDDDDWQSADRLSRQIEHHQMTGRAVVGACSYLQWAEGRPHGWRVYDRITHSAGAFLAFDRQWALDHPFKDGRGVAEDSIFTWEAVEAHQYSAISGLDIAVLSLHGSHDSGRVDPETSLPAGILNASENYFIVPYEKFAHIVEVNWKLKKI